MPRPGPVRLSLPLIAFVVANWLVAGLAAATLMPWRRDWIAAAVAACLVAGMAAYAISDFGAVRGRWSASGFFHLAFSYAIGPPAILAMAIGESLGSAARRRPGAFRTLFNMGDHFLADGAAWWVFQHAVGRNPGVIALALGGAAGAVAESVVNLGLLAFVVWLAGESSGFRSWLHSLTNTVPIALLFGVTAAGATLLYHQEGTFGIVSLLLPLALVQASLVALARRAHEQALAEQSQTREREALLRREAQALRRAGDASEVERKRIAADLHDSVIQDVSGLLLRSSAMLGRLSDGDEAVWSREGAEDFLSYTHQLAAEAVRELRTLMVELAPPLLDEEGLASALRQLLTRLDRDQITWVLECTNQSLDQRHQRLVYRVVQEGLRNIVEHAECRHVWVAVRVDRDRLAASIRDDGRGFSAAERAESRKRGHAGLGLLAQTVHDGGGELAVRSSPGRGTTVEFSVPMLPAPVPEDGASELPASSGAAGASLEGSAAAAGLASGPNGAHRPAAAGRPAQGRKRRGAAEAASAPAP